MHESRKNNGAPRQPMPGTPPQEKLTLVQRTRLAKGTPLVSKADMDRETVERFRARQERMQPPPSWPAIPSKPYGVHPAQVSQSQMVAPPVSQRTPAQPPKMTSNGLPIRNDYYSQKHLSARDRENMPAPTPFPSQPLRKNGGVAPHPNAPQEFQPSPYPYGYSLQKLQETMTRQELIDTQFQLGYLFEKAKRNGEDPVVAQIHEQLLRIDDIQKQRGPVPPPGGGPFVFSPPPEEVACDIKKLKFKGFINVKRSLILETVSSTVYLLRLYGSNGKEGDEQQTNTPEFLGLEIEYDNPALPGDSSTGYTSQTSGLSDNQLKDIWTHSSDNKKVFDGMSDLLHKHMDEIEKLSKQGASESQIEDQWKKYEKEGDKYLDLHYVYVYEMEYVAICGVRILEITSLKRSYVRLRDVNLFIAK